jgi:pyruvate dehydrogenase E2 component (dihydrolipoamide acetyltransferase)
MMTPADSGEGSGSTSKPLPLTITRWLVREGGGLKRDQDYVEVSTDKVDTALPSPVQGRVRKLLYREGDAVPPDAKIIDVDEDAAPPSASEASRPS